MNIFALDIDPRLAAQAHLDRHVVKMILEYAQLLSTAHRLLDGRLELHKGPNTKPKKFWLLGNETVVEKEFIHEHVDEEAGEIVNLYEYKLVVANPTCYSLSHHNHPCAVWARTTRANYMWLAELLRETVIEYTHRYGKPHKTWTDVGAFLSAPPKNIKDGGMTVLPQAMPDEYKVPNDSIAAYKNYYLGAKAGFAVWTNREVPSWFKQRFPGYTDAAFQRTSQLGRSKNLSTVRDADGVLNSAASVQLQSASAAPHNGDESNLRRTASAAHRAQYA